MATPTNSRTPQPIRRSSTAPIAFVLKRTGPINSSPDKLDIDIAYKHRHKRGSHSVSNDEAFSPQTTRSTSGGTDSEDQAGSVTADSKKGAGASLFRRISKVGSSSLKSISGTVKRATSTRLARNRDNTRTAQARGRHERSLSESQATDVQRREVYTKTNLLSSGISEGMVTLLGSPVIYNTPR